MSTALLAFDPYNLLATALFTILLQACFFTLATIFKTDKFTDITYSLNFVLLAGGLLFVQYLSGDVHLRSLVLAGIIMLWGLRLGAYLLTRILRIEKDDRFDGMREGFISFLKFWIFQALVVWLVLLPATLALSLRADAQPAWGLLDSVALGLWILGFGIEAVADHQKFVFRNDSQNDGEWIQSGLWRYSRHPNYFGEILLWWAVFLLAFPPLLTLNAIWPLAVALLGPLSITLILLFVSGIPLLEEKADRRYSDRADYQAYKRGTSILIPWFPAKS